MFHGGGIAGIGSHQYIHNTPADYRYGIKRPPLTISDTSFYTYSAFRAYEPQLGYLAIILVSRYQRTFNVVSNLTILGYTLLTKLTPLCHPMRSIKQKPIVICSRTFNRASPQHVYFPTRVSYDTQLKNALSLGKMQCQCTLNNLTICIKEELTL